MKDLKEIFKTEKPIIGMIHLDYLEGQQQFQGIEHVKKQALEDLEKLQNGGVDAVIIENWKDNTFGAFVEEKTKKCMLEIAREVAKSSKIPVGINVLPNDYRTAFGIAEELKLPFIQLDVLVDEVKTDYSYSDAQQFSIKVSIEDFGYYRKKHNCDNVLVLASVQPKHYKMLEENKSIEQSTIQAIEAGADIVVVTGAVTGSQPELDKVKLAKKIAGNIPVFIGSGLNKDNAKELLSSADGAIVGTAFKTEDFKKVDQTKVEELIKKIREI